MSLLKKFVTRVTRSEVARIDRLYGRHAGEECYIFGDGVSLKWMDLDAFADRPAMMATMGVYLRDLRRLQVRYCMNTEPYWFWPVYPNRTTPTGKPEYVRHRAHEEYRRSIRENPDLLFFLNISNYPVIRGRNIQFVSRWYAPPFESRNPFKDRPDAHHGTLAFQLSLAIFLGFRRAYLVGHDYTHMPSMCFHFYEKGQGLRQDHHGFMKDMIDYAKQYIDLITVTLDAGSETMQAITYTELTGRQPRYRENVEIVHEAALNSLRISPEGYVI